MRHLSRSKCHPRELTSFCRSPGSTLCQSRNHSLRVASVSEPGLAPHDGEHMPTVHTSVAIAWVRKRNTPSSFPALLPAYSSLRCCGYNLVLWSCWFLADVLDALGLRAKPLLAKCFSQGCRRSSWLISCHEL